MVLKSKLAEGGRGRLRGRARPKTLIALRRTAAMQGKPGLQGGQDEPPGGDKGRSGFAWRVRPCLETGHSAPEAYDAGRLNAVAMRGDRRRRPHHARRAPPVASDGPGR
jgi:hypothetical protein